MRLNTRLRLAGDHFQTCLEQIGKTFGCRIYQSISVFDHTKKVLCSFMRCIRVSDVPFCKWVKIIEDTRHKTRQTVMLQGSFCKVVVDLS